VIWALAAVFGAFAAAAWPGGGLPLYLALGGLGLSLTQRGDGESVRMRWEYLLWPALLALGSLSWGLAGTIPVFLLLHGRCELDARWTVCGGMAAAGALLGSLL
jgi:hypothetical protein